MKKLRLVLVSLGLAISASSFAQVAIGKSVIHPSAILHLESDTNDPRGFLMPRMENKERLDILEPAEGLQVYVTNFEDGTIMFFEDGKWKAFTQLSSRPGGPTDVEATATATSGEATITFIGPSDDGGSPITSYTATSSPGDITGTTTEVDASGNGSITVTGLTPGQSYTFTVTATNTIGTSLPSIPSAQVEL